MIKLENFNRHFGVDLTEKEWPLARDFAVQCVEELELDPYETDEHWYVAIEKVMDLRGAQ